VLRCVQILFLSVGGHENERTGTGAGEKVSRERERGGVERSVGRRLNFAGQQFV
jgi:hypothetical protein